jgi:hypothetical protein
MSVAGGDGITLHKITQYADITGKKKTVTWIQIYLKCWIRIRIRIRIQWIRILNTLGRRNYVATWCLDEINLPHFLFL